jgi:LacI family transcriptional regulator
MLKGFNDHDISLNQRAVPCAAGDVITPKVTVRDVAAAAGVSVATVSKVVSGRYGNARIAPATEERVRAIVAELQYVPHHAALSLLNSRVGQIGIAIGDAELHEVGAWTELNGALFLGLREGAREGRIAAVVLYPQPDEGTASDPMRYLDGRIDGLLVRDSMHRADPLLGCLDPARMPVVALWRQAVPDGIGFVDIDHRGGAMLAVDHLLELGHRRIVLFSPVIDSDDMHTALRREGYAEAMLAAGVVPAPAWYVHDVVELLCLLRQPEPPTAVFALSDSYADVLADVLEAEGLRIPSDVSLVGFDNSALSRRIAGGLTTVSNPIQEMTIQGVRNLLGLIAGKPLAECRSILPCSLVVRRSTAPPLTGVRVPRYGGALEVKA